MKNYGIPLLLIASLLPAAAQQKPTTTTASAQPPAAVGGNDTVVEEIVARVNNSIITRADLRRAHDGAAEEIKQNNVPDHAKALDQRDRD